MCMHTYTIERGALCRNSHGSAQTGRKEFIETCFVRLSMGTEPWACLSQMVAPSLLQLLEKYPSPHTHIRQLSKWAHASTGRTSACNSHYPLLDSILCALCASPIQPTHCQQDVFVQGNRWRRLLSRYKERPPSTMGEALIVVRAAPVTIGSAGQTLLSFTVLQDYSHHMRMDMMPSPMQRHLRNESLE